MRNRITAYLLLLLVSIIWGFASPVSKNTLKFLTPFDFLFWRFLLSVVLTTPIFLWYLKKHPLAPANLPRLILLGFVATTLNLSLLYTGLQKTTALETTLISSMSPLFVVIGSILFLQEKVSRRTLAGITLAITGIVFTIIEPFLANRSASSATALEGNILVLLADLTWMVFVLVSKKWIGEGIKPFHVTAVSFYTGLASFLPITLLLNKGLPALPPPTVGVIFGIAYLAIFCSLIAYSAYEIALSKIEASQVDLFNYLQPVWAAPLAIFWLGETFGTTQAVGIILIVCGITLAEYRSGLLKGLQSHHLAHHK